MTTLYRITLFARAESVAEVEGDLATTLGYSQLDTSIDSIEVEPEDGALPSAIPATRGE